MEPTSLEYSAETGVRSWPTVRSFGLATSAGAVTSLLVSLGMYVHVLPGGSIPRFGDVQPALAWASVALGVVGAPAALAAFLKNRSGPPERLGLLLALTYIALLTVALLFFN
jgi:hypothetical protein